MATVDHLGRVLFPCRSFITLYLTLSGSIPRSGCIHSVVMNRTFSMRFKVVIIPMDFDAVNQPSTSAWSMDPCCFSAPKGRLNDFWPSLLIHALPYFEGAWAGEVLRLTTVMTFFVLRFFIHFSLARFFRSDRIAKGSLSKGRTHTVQRSQNETLPGKVSGTLRARSNRSSKNDLFFRKDDLFFCVLLPHVFAACFWHQLYA